MATIAYIRCITNLGYRQMEDLIDGMLGRAHEGPSCATIWRRVGTSAVNIQNSRVTVGLDNGTACNLIADSTGISATDCSEWTAIKWKVKHNFIKLHVLIEVKSQKILAFRITDVSGGDAAQTPGVLDEALKWLGMPLATKPALETDTIRTAPREETGHKS